MQIFFNLRIDKATKTHGNKQLYLITHFTKRTLNLNWVIPEKIHTSPTDGKLEILAGGGEDSSGNPGVRRDLNRKILPRGSL